MRGKIFKLAAAVLAGVCVTTGILGPLEAQSRIGLKLQAPGQLTRIGEGSSNRFRNYSYGLGSLGSSATGTSSVLRSNITNSSFSLRRSATASSGSALRSNIANSSAFRSPKASMGLKTSAAALSGSARTTRVRQHKSSPSSPLAITGNVGRSSSLKATSPQTSDLAGLGAARSYLDLVSGASSADLQDSNQMITSFVPTEPGTFQTHMAAGETAFRMEDYNNAKSKFRLARYVAPNAPEGLLSMAHTHFAMSRFSYASAAYYLREALKYFPELPLTSIKPKGFYGNTTTYVSHIVRLQEHLDSHPTDADAQLVLAYFRWFGQDIEAAHNALSEALAVAMETDNKDMMEAIDTFWSGMVASEKVNGELQPAVHTKPETTPGTPENPPKPSTKEGSAEK